MNQLIKTSLLAIIICLFSCQSLVKDINDNPNGITIEEIDANQFLTGAMLANTIVQVGHLNRIGGMYSGQLQGLSSLYANIFGYSISTVESSTTWSRIYIGVIPNVRHIRAELPDDKLMQGICKMLEANAISTGASLFGDVPYSEINNEEIDDPKFDGQVSVFNAVLKLLDEAIADLGSAKSRGLKEDIYYGGDADLWKAAAYTLKARIYMHLKDYGSAYTAASSGISSYENNMQHIPQGEASISEGNKNLFWEILEGSRAGDIGSSESYLSQLLDTASSVYRGNAKTNEIARGEYSYIYSSGGAANKGIIEQYEKQNIISFEENHLILAEAGARSKGFETGLKHLNEYRAWLNSGGRLNANFSDMPYQYDAYVAADFQSGGMENKDGIDATRALLREIIEERYVSGFGQFMPFDDARRLRKSDGDIAVPIPLNTLTANQQPERLPYSDDELNANSNGPGEDPGIYTVTEVNK